MLQQLSVWFRRSLSEDAGCGGPGRCVTRGLRL